MGDNMSMYWVAPESLRNSYNNPDSSKQKKNFKPLSSVLPFLWILWSGYAEKIFNLYYATETVRILHGRVNVHFMIFPHILFSVLKFSSLCCYVLLDVQFLTLVSPEKPPLKLKGGKTGPRFVFALQFWLFVSAKDGNVKFSEALPLCSIADSWVQTVALKSDGKSLLDFSWAQTALALLLSPEFCHRCGVSWEHTVLFILKRFFFMNRNWGVLYLINASWILL